MLLHEAVVEDVSRKTLPASPIQPRSFWLLRLRKIYTEVRLLTNHCSLLLALFSRQGSKSFIFSVILEVRSRFERPSAEVRECRSYQNEGQTSTLLREPEMSKAELWRCSARSRDQAKSGVVGLFFNIVDAVCCSVDWFCYDGW